MHKSLRKSVAKRRTGVKVAVASVGTCLYRWNERRLSKKNTSSSVAPITEHRDSTVIYDDQEIFGIGVIQENVNVDDFGSDPELCATETEFDHSSSDNGEDGHGDDEDEDEPGWRRRARKSERGRFLPENPRIHTVLERHR